MPEIPLTQGQVAIVDDVDYEFLTQFKWCAGKYKKGFYAVRTALKDEPNPGQTILMHRVLAERMGFDAPQIDHADRDQLNNRRSNLRRASASQNSHNQGMPSHNTSGYMGVTYRERLGKWVAQTNHEGKYYYLGIFDDPAKASEVYKKKKRELAGEFTPEEIKDA